MSDEAGDLIAVIQLVVALITHVHTQSAHAEHTVLGSAVDHHAVVGSGAHLPTCR